MTEKPVQKENTKNNQPIPGPVFEAGPGWGEKTKNWLAKNFIRKILPIVAILILLFGIASLFSRPKQSAQKKAPDETIIVTVEKGDGLISVARRALAEYVTDFPEIVLKPEQKLYIDNFFKQKLDQQKLVIGGKIEFFRKDLEQSVNEALALPENKLEKLRAYLH